MGHTIKLQLFDVAGDHYTAVGTAAVDTSATGYFLVSKEFSAPIVEPVEGNTVVESLVVMVRGSSLADLRTKLATIYDYCDQVRRFEAGQNTMFGRIYFQPGGTGNAFVSRLYEIEARVGSEILHEQWANWEVDVTLIYARDAWWEDVQVRAVTMTLGVNTFTSLVLANVLASNYADIDTIHIDGDMSAPLNIDITNDYNDASGIQSVILGGVTSYSGVIAKTSYEAEDGTGGTAQTDATCSPGGAGNTKVSMSVTTTEAALLTWALDHPERYAGLWYRVIGRWAAATNIGSVKLRWKLMNGSTVVWSGNQFLLENATNLMQEMSDVRLPPAVGWTGTLSLSLWGVSTTGSTVAVALDYICLMASGQSQKLTGYSPVEYEKILNTRSSIDITDMPRHVDGSGVMRDWYAKWNPTLNVYPGKYHRVMVITVNETGDAEILRINTVQMSYRPRYRVVGE